MNSRGEGIMEHIHRVLSSIWLIHFFVFLGLFSLYGFLSTRMEMFIFFSVLSFCGAVCGAFIRVIDSNKSI